METGGCLTGILSRDVHVKSRFVRVCYESDSLEDGGAQSRVPRNCAYFFVQLSMVRGA